MTPPVDSAPAAPEELDGADLGEALASLRPEDLAEEVLEGRARLTPEVVRILNETWRELVQYDDDGSKRRCRLIVGVLRRAKHIELHPGCSRVLIDVPMLPNKQFVRVNERVFYGSHEVWECEARTILGLVHWARVVEAQRMDDRRSEHPTIDLDSPLAERARAIQRA